MSPAPISLYIVNLPEQEVRRRFMQAQLDHLPDGCKVEWIEAVDGRRLSDAERAGLSEAEWAIRLTGRPLNPGELGCALSHRLIYRRMQEKKEAVAVVLEDDAVLFDGFPEAVAAVAANLDPERPAIVLLGDFFVPSCWRRGIGGGVKMMRAWRGRSTLGYMLTRAAARALEQAQTPVRRAADWWPDLERHRIIETWGILPSVVAPSLLNRASGIGAGRAQPPVPVLRKIAGKAADAWFHISSWRA